MSLMGRHESEKALSSVESMICPSIFGNFLHSYVGTNDHFSAKHCGTPTYSLEGNVPLVTKTERQVTPCPWIYRSDENYEKDFGLYRTSGWGCLSSGASDLNERWIDPGNDYRPVGRGNSGGPD